jgi:hypothetical protein
MIRDVFWHPFFHRGKAFSSSAPTHRFATAGAAIRYRAIHRRQVRGYRRNRCDAEEDRPELIRDLAMWTLLDASSAQYPAELSRHLYQPKPAPLTTTSALKQPDWLASRTRFEPQQTVHV